MKNIVKLTQGGQKIWPLNISLKVLLATFFGHRVCIVDMFTLRHAKVIFLAKLTSIKVWERCLGRWRAPSSYIRSSKTLFRQR